MRKLLYTALILQMAILPACSDWLDVQPDASVELKKLFSSEEGFCEAVNGLYTKANNYSYYGGVFTVEMMDAMAQNYSYNVYDYTDYAETSAFDITHPAFKSRLASVWSSAYNAIVNCNLILENIETRKHLFQPGMYEIVKGETLALRAYFHFDLLRLFVAPYSADPAADAIPYVTTYSNKVTPTSSVDKVMENILADLNNAKTLLAGHDPILDPEYTVSYIPNSGAEPESTEEDSANLFLQNRRHRMNYYAVCGTLARAYLWKGDHKNALSNAEEIIGGDKFRFVDPATFAADYKTAARDRIMYPELVFAWYNEKNIKKLDNVFDNTVMGNFVNTAHLKAIYESTGVGMNDRRYQGWFVSTTASNDNMQIIKYLRNPSEIGNKHPMMAPAIRLGEIYFIIAECTYQTDPAAAWAMLNVVRIERDVSQFTTGDFYAELLKEYRKETYGEGQAFFAYKRLGRNIVSELGVVYTPSVFSNFPLPDDEIEFGERK